MKGIVKTIKVLTVICGFVAGLKAFAFVMLKNPCQRVKKSKRTKICSIGMVNGADEPTVFCIMRLPSYQTIKRFASIISIIGAALQGFIPKKQN